MSKYLAEDSVVSDSVPKEVPSQAYKQFCRNHSLAVQSKESLGKTLKTVYKFEDGRESSGDRRTIWNAKKLAIKYNIDYRQEIMQI